jgi:hypothetical protein
VVVGEILKGMHGCGAIRALKGMHDCGAIRALKGMHGCGVIRALKGTRRCGVLRRPRAWHPAEREPSDDVTLRCAASCKLLAALVQGEACTVRLLLAACVTHMSSPTPQPHVPSGFIQTHSI